MVEMKSLPEAVAEFRRNFDQFYLGVIPRLLTDDGMFLSFVSTLTAIEALSGAFAPDESSGARFRMFVKAYFPPIYAPFASSLWEFRNRMIHAFNPTPFLIICHNSRMHLEKANGVPMLNAEDFYADSVAASRAYFKELYKSVPLQDRFRKRITQDGGGSISIGKVVETVQEIKPMSN